MMFKHSDFIAFFSETPQAKEHEGANAAFSASSFKKCIIAWQFRHQFQSFVPLLLCSFLLPSSKLLKDGCVTLRVSD